MRLPFAFRILALTLIYLTYGAPSAHSQEVPVWNTDSIRGSVIRLLEQYEFHHNNLKASGGLNAERAFVRLFSNPKILVVSDFLTDPPSQRISVQDYTEAIIDNFPEGVTVNLRLQGLRVGKPVFDRIDRYLLKVRVNQAKTAIKEGKVLRTENILLIQIAFYWDGEAASGFEIFGIELPPVTNDFLGIQVSPGISKIYNRSIQSDDRFTLKPSAAGAVSLFYQRRFGSSWGVIAGIQGAGYENRLTLDKFDPNGGFDAGFSDVVFANRFWEAGFPVLVSWDRRISPRFNLFVNFGGAITCRIYEQQSVSAWNSGLGQRFNHVISDPDWVSQLNRFSAAAQLEVGAGYLIRSGMTLFAGLQGVAGLTSLDRNTRLDYSASKYLGAYNPLWGNESATTPGKLTFTIGLLWKIGPVLP